MIALNRLLLFIRLMGRSIYVRREPQCCRSQSSIAKSHVRHGLKTLNINATYLIVHRERCELGSCSVKVDPMRPADKKHDTCCLPTSGHT